MMHPSPRDRLVDFLHLKNKFFIAERSMLATTAIEQRALLIDEAGRHPLAAHAHPMET